VTHGLPFYGRHTRTGDWKSWEDLVQMHLPKAGVDEVGGYILQLHLPLPPPLTLTLTLTRWAATALTPRTPTPTPYP
jgi:hypothetical protein